MPSSYACFLFSTYVGEVRDGLRHGQGTYWCAVTGSTYVGQWVAGRRQGRGRIDYSPPGGRERGEEKEEESYYDGNWVDNQQEGFGTRRYRYIHGVIIMMCIIINFVGRG